ncbi:MAG: 8-oxo-dGTP diphosphatase [Candidatus Latescibacterota bacterium]|nr:8-oxo-dGTP diphosphatase [Candidatus Latescibacterota bacterium]
MSYRNLSSIDWINWQPVEQGTLMYIFNENSVLLIRKKRGLGAGKINGPGGRIENGETPVDCAVRETREEVGVCPVKPFQVGRMCYQCTDGYSMDVSIFRSESYWGDLRSSDEAEPFWTDVSKIPYGEMWPTDRNWLPLVINRQSFTVYTLYDEDTVLGCKIKIGIQ